MRFFDMKETMDVMRYRYMLLNLVAGNYVAGLWRDDLGKIW